MATMKMRLILFSVISLLISESLAVVIPGVGTVVCSPEQITETCLKCKTYCPYDPNCLFTCLTGCKCNVTHLAADNTECLPYFVCDKAGN
ncbi:hypothetical protein GDO81_014612 [Engystomops pustulosus]|uniref:Uncharacterized protein n=1 Tax=Engystomops pustulosus TaxID=76066 RepID=A0AAV7BBS7_ENGPU|nr:hypothetical protein GDO81_014612 [Engystomops pustulosus]